MRNCSSKMKLVLFVGLMISVVCFLLLCSCSPAPKSEDAIVKELAADPYFLDGTDVQIKQYNIIKRQTETESTSDTVYIEVQAESDGFEWDRSYIMTYGLYNEGWILDDVAAYNQNEWTLTLTKGVSDEAIEETLNAIKRENDYSRVDIVDRTTQLDALNRNDQVEFEVEKEHLYGTEVETYVQMWVFNDSLYTFVTAGEPVRIDRKVFLNDNIVGAVWENNLRYSDSMDLFSDKFDFEVIGRSEEGYPTFRITRKIGHVWNNEDIPDITVEYTFDTLAYLDEYNGGMIGFPLYELAYSDLYTTYGDTSGMFDLDDFFVFDLDEPHMGHIESIVTSNALLLYANDGVLLRYLDTGESPSDIQLGRISDKFDEYNMSLFDICGAWYADTTGTEDADEGIGYEIFTFWPDGTFDMYADADAVAIALGREYLGTSLMQGFWERDVDASTQQDDEEVYKLLVTQVMDDGAPPQVAGEVVVCGDVMSITEISGDESITVEAVRIDILP